MMKDKYLFRKVVLGLILASSPLRGFSCGELAVPKNHFDGVNEQGNLSWWSQMDTLDLGQDFKVPLIIGFKSSRETVSPYAGKSWIIPLLESNLVEIDENNFLLTKPDGSTRRFYRAKITDTVLESTGGWKAEIRDQVINVWAECGWKFSYLLGKLTSLTTPKNQKLDLLYNGDRVTEVREGGGQTVLTVEVDPRTGRVSGLAFNGKRIGIEQDQKPRIEAIQGQNLIGGMDSALSKLTLADGSVKTFEYAPDEKLQPTMKISDLPVAARQAKDGTPASSVEHRTSNVERILTWDAATKLALKDISPKGEWTYDIKPDENNPWANAAIGRTNEKREREFWLMDREHGRQIIQTLDGVKTEKVWFPSGLLARKMRRVEETKDGKTKLVEAWTYDEKGLLLREMKDGVITSFQYDDSGNQVASLQGEKVLWKKEYDLQKHVISELCANGDRVQHKYLAENSYEQITLFSDGKKQTDLFETGELRQRTFPDGKTERYQYYHDDGSLKGALKERIDSEGIVWHYAYDPSTGQVNEIQRNGRFWSRCFFDQKKKRNLTVSYNTDGGIIGAFETATLIPIDNEDLKALLASKNFFSPSRP